MTKCSHCGKKLSIFSQQFQWRGKTVCDDCFVYFLSEEKLKEELSSIEKSILWQKEEHTIDITDCGFSNGLRANNYDGNRGYLVLTNQRIIFLARRGSFFCLVHFLNLEDVTGASAIGRKELEIVDKTNKRITFLQMPSQRIIPMIKLAVIEQKNQVLAEKQKERIQIVLDFSSLKEVMAKGGLVMPTYKCPNCNGMVNIPEAGKILVCQYCGTPIKPVDIFEKIRTLIT